MASLGTVLKASLKKQTPLLKEEDSFKPVSHRPDFSDRELDSFVHRLSQSYNQGTYDSGSE